MMTDPIADMLTRIRNANRIERPLVDIPGSKLKTAVAEVLKDEGFIHDFQVGRMVPDEQGQPHFQEEQDLTQPHILLRVYLKYGPEGERVIRRIKRISTPGCRRYVKTTELKPVLGGLGISILSTSRGVMSDRRARSQRVGGEIICTVW